MSVSPRTPGRAAMDAAALAYLEWLERCSDVWDAYARWTATTGVDAKRAHAGYQAALDREEAAALIYAMRMQRLGHFAAPAGVS
jgi:hypothetical protein